MSNSIPLSVVMENARRKFKRDVNNLIKETNLPAFLLELVLLDALADIRENKCLEITSDINGGRLKRTAHKGKVIYMLKQWSAVKII